jgi:oligopeptidase B
MDEQHRPNRVYLHILGTPQSDDLCVYTEEDPLFWLGLDKTANDRFVVISSGSKETSECHVIDLNGVIGGPGHLEAAGRLALVKQRQFGLRYEVEQHGDHFYFITNADGAKNNKLVRTPVSTVLTEQQGVWEDVRAYNPAEQIDDIHVFSGHIAIFGREEGVQRLWTVDLSASVSDWHAVPFSEVAYSIGAAHNCVFDCDTLRLTYSSFVTPKQVLDYNMSTQATAVLKVQEVPHYNASQYECVRIHAPSEDGTRSIPMSVVYNKKVLRASTAAVDVAGAVTAGKAELVNQPTILYGYGSYGACIDPSFDFKRTALLDRGVVYVIAHIRGGGEMGRAWYEDEGKYLTKRNTFSDFAACARHLVDQKITASDRLAIVGRSAGGLLIGAVCNMYPSLFKAAVADVPFVDVLNTMSDPTIPLTVVEWEEWGNPNEEKYHDYMRSYSPYDNVARQEYPAMLVTAGLNDPRVPYWEPAKWVAKLRAMKTDGNPLYLKTDLTTGHFSASDRYKYIKETAFEYAFMLDQIGAKLPI